LKPPRLQPRDPYIQNSNLKPPIQNSNLKPPEPQPYMPPTVEDVPDNEEPTQIQTSPAKIRPDSTSIPQKKVCFALLPPKIECSAPKPQEPTCTKPPLPTAQQPPCHPLNPGRPIQHPKLSSLLYTSSGARVTVKVGQEDTETQIIETALLLCPTSHLPPACLVQGCYLISALQS
jgi:hypothetical protein